MLLEVNGFPGYFVSDDGCIFSTRKGCLTKLRLNKTRNEYLSIMLRNGKTKKQFLVHRLVANAFIPNPMNLPQVNHRDENKENNAVSNLEWCTARYNQNYGTCKARIKETKKTRHYEVKGNHKNERAVNQYDLNGNLIETYESIKKARESTGINNICYCAKGKFKQCGGYIWKYATERI